MQSVQVRVEHPTSSFPAAEPSDLAVAGCYRLIEQPADSQVTPENILAPHRRRTLRRTQGQDALLRIQDGADLNFAEHPGCAGWARSAGTSAPKARRACPCMRRWRSLPLAPPRRGEFRGAAPVGLHLAHLPEESPADAVEPLE